MTSGIVDHIPTTNQEIRENSGHHAVDINQHSTNLIIVMVDYLKKFSRTDLPHSFGKQSLRNLIADSGNS